MNAMRRFGCAAAILVFAIGCAGGTETQDRGATAPAADAAPARPAAPPAQAPGNASDDAPDSVPVAAAPAAAPAPATGTIVGTLLRDDNPVPLPFAAHAVTLLQDGEPVRTTQTDGWGRFAFDGVPAGDAVAVLAEEPGAATEHLAGLRVLPGERRDVGTLRLGPPARFDVYVLDDTGRPVSGVPVEAYRSDGGPLGDRVDLQGCWLDRAAPAVADVPAATVTTDEGGRATFDVPAMRSFTFAAQVPGLARVAKAWNFRRAGVRDEVVLMLPRPAPLSGRVLDAQGRPAAGAVVLARVAPRIVNHHHGWGAEGPGLWQRADADSEGRYAFHSLAPGEIALLAAAQGGTPAWVAFVQTPGVSALDLTLCATGTVRGRLTCAAGDGDADGAAGAPIPGATIAVQAGFAVRLAVTDADGRYVLEGLPAGSCAEDVALPPGFTSLTCAQPHEGSAEIPAGGDVRIDWTARRAAIVEGTVTCGGAPVSGAVVDVLAVEGDPGELRFGSRGLTDAQGRYRIEDIRPGRVAVCATPPGASDDDVRKRFCDVYEKDADERDRLAFDAPAGAVARRDVEVPPVPPGSDPDADAAARMERMADEVLGKKRVAFTCRVHTADGTPVRDGRVIVQPAEFGDVRSAFFDRPAAPVGHDGTVVVVERAKVEATTFVVGAEDADHDLAVVRDVAVAADAREVTVDVILPPLPVLSCRVVAGGEPVPDATVLASWTVVARPSDAGRFDLRWRTGTVTLGVRAPGFVRAEFEDLDVPGDGVQDLELEPACVIAGVVVGSDGAPLAGVTVTPLGADGDLLPAYDADTTGGWRHGPVATIPVTDADGRFRLDELAEGEYRLRVDSAPGAGSKVATWTSPPVATGTTDVRLAARAPSRVVGRVVDPEGKPVVRAQVECFGDDEATGEEENRSARTDAAGVFAFADVLAGRYRIDVTPRSGDELVPARVRVASGDTPVEVRLDRAGVFEGVVLDENGSPVARLDVEPRRLDATETDRPRWMSRLEVETNREGRFRICVPPAGRYTFGIVPRSQTAQWGVLRGGAEVTPGGAPLHLTLFRGVPISGVVLTEKGTETRNAEITLVAPGLDRTVVLNGTGEFRLGGCAAGGAADVVLRAPGRVTKILRGVAAGTSGLRVTLEIGDSITGRLLDARGRPAEGWRVRALRGDEPDLDLWRADVNARGEFSVQGLDDRDWKLEAVVEEAGAVVRSVPLGTFRWKSRNLVLRLPK